MIESICSAVLFAESILLVGFGICVLFDGIDLNVTCTCCCGRTSMRKVLILPPGDRGPIEAQLTRICPHCSPQEPSAISRQPSGVTS